MQKNALVHIGTSGWHYGHWKKVFYPDGISSPRFLSYYAAYFQTVEINNSFYRLPEKETLKDWRETVPPRFLFAVKASRYITEAKKLKDPDQGLARLFERIDVLGDKLGPVLFQLPPRWRVNTERLASFLKALPAGYRYAFEFREPSWYDRRIYGLLAAHNAAFCIHDHQGSAAPLEVTGDMVYVRFHGPQDYPAAELSRWEKLIRQWKGRGKEVYCYFNNDHAGYAVKNALTLKQMLGLSAGVKQYK